MKRREFGIAGVSALALAALERSAFAQREAKRAPHAAHGEKMESCAKACSDCQRECDRCSTHCAGLLENGKKEHAATLMSCQDCADVCAAASHITARGGPFAEEICKACAEVCAGCAEACEKIPHDEHMKKCAAECRKCEQACRAMIG